MCRDRERGVPRFNEFRRQYGLRHMARFEDFVDQRLAAGSPARVEQERLVGLMREVYGQHRCDASKIISTALRNADGSPINDCLGQPNGSLVDNVEDVDTVVGWLAEFTRPHGFAISETQFQVFILNASRRLFSDRFFTSSFRPEFYTHLGVRWVNDNGPDGKQMEAGKPNGHAAEVSPMKRVLLAHPARTGARAGAGGQCLRPLGAGPGRFLLDRVEAEEGGGGRQRVWPRAVSPRTRRYPELSNA